VPRAPGRPRARVSANLEALRILAQLEREQRPAEGEERELLARWSSWGAVPQIFDEANPEWAGARDELRELLDADAWRAARRTTINAHYTDPQIAEAMWQALGDLGFQAGRVLEPGAGAGTFIALAPAGVHLTAVELDSSTARIAQAIHPQATIRAESFAQTPLPDGYFDAAIGNVPFADVRLHDPRHNPSRLSLHNHFIVKALSLVHEGGLVAVLTSHYTMDAHNPAARREIGQLGELLGAVRLPTGAHRRTAGTDALTDLLILRRREATDGPEAAEWETTREIGVAGGGARINRYFAEQPDRVLGELSLGHGMYGQNTLQVHPADGLDELPDQLAAQLGKITALARVQSRTFTPRSETQEVERGLSAAPAASEGLWDGHLSATPDAKFTILINGQAEPFDVPRAHRVELRQLLDLRDRARELLSAEAATLQDTPGLAELRGRLCDRYSGYLARYGAINRFTHRRTGRTDPETDEERLARITPRAVQLLRCDPFAPLVRALEVFDDSTQRAAPATLLSERVVAPRAPRLGAETPQDALAICLDTHGRVDLEEIAALLGQEPEEARRALGELVYHDPAAGQLVPAAEYLSGDVRSKLAAARRAIGEDPELQVNVAALERVLPADLGVEDIEPRLGAAWIDADTHRQFLSEILDDDTVAVEHPGGAIWAIRARNQTVRATSEWGTGRMPAAQIAKAAIEQRPIQVTDEIDDGQRVRRVVNPTETTAAQEKAQAMQQRFAEWCWEQPDRTSRLLEEYNRRFNSLVLRDYTGAGAELTLPGLTRTFTPQAHQRAAVARIIAEPAVGLFHCVGAGKTAAMAIGVMELRRLGLVRKPCVVVPNHMLEQFSREWLGLYPAARLLAASTQDLAGDKRRTFVARAAANDWDAIVMTRSAFERIPVSPDVQAAYAQREIDGLRKMLASARGADGLTVKRLEKLALAAEQRLAERLDSAKDPGVTFEQTGIDYLCVDEAHDYKNLHTPSNIRDAAIDGSQRASDLHMKIGWLRDRHGGRTVTLATATPIANSVTEAHVMCRYLRPDLLQAAGVEDFDSWAATFGQTVTEIEMAPTGGGNYRMHTRFSRFQNVPEMLRQWHVFADARTAEDLRLPRPQLAERPDGRRAPQTVLTSASAELRAYVAALGERAEQVRAGAVSPEQDNMLLISTDGRKAALDMRLVGGQPEPGSSKLDVAADTIAAVWREHREGTYRDPGGGPSPTPGALQIVFCDLSTPTGPNWNAYRELRDQLAARGIPAEQVRWIHEARNDAEKARLFQACRAGQIAVIIGSTPRMGVGTNIQDRAIALHHLDCPWRPADIEQREGRALRQGNQNPEIRIFRYAVEGSFDSYSWQTVERKARFINQMMNGQLDHRQVEDIGDNALSFAEVKALASGDPLILDKAQADAEHARLSRLQRAWQRNLQNLRITLADSTGLADRLRADRAAIAGAIARTRPIGGEAFQMQVGRQTVHRRIDAASLLARCADRINVYRRQAVPLGRLTGLELDATVRRDLVDNELILQVSLRGLPVAPAEQLLRHARANGSSIVRQLEHRVRDLPDARDRIAGREHAAREQAVAAGQALRQPFKYADELHSADARCAAIAEEMTARHRDVDSDTFHSGAPTSAVDADTAEIRRLVSATFPSCTPLSPRASAASTSDTHPPVRAPATRPQPTEHRSR